MKNYFDFQLTGRKLLPVWALFLVLFIAPYVALIMNMKSYGPGEKPSLMIFPYLLVLVIVAMAISFYLTKLVIEHVAWKEQRVEFHGSFGRFLGVVIPGILFTIITLGIYSAWFVRNMHRFYVNKSSYDTNPFKFNGKGGKLFLIMLLTIILPTILFSVALAKYMLTSTEPKATVMIVQQIVMMFIMIPYMYLIYKWMVNISYKDFKISWETNFWNSCGRLAVEILLVIVTFGIYFPLAIIRMYKYFADRTVAVSEVRKLQFGYEADQLNDFLFLWGQTLLTILTLGIYYPWALCKTWKRIFSRTFLTEM